MIKYETDPSFKYSILERNTITNHKISTILIGFELILYVCTRFAPNSPFHPVLFNFFFGTKNSHNAQGVTLIFDVTKTRARFKRLSLSPCFEQCQLCSQQWRTLVAPRPSQKTSEQSDNLCTLTISASRPPSFRPGYRPSSPSR